ncbi:MAG: response regulator transcription factor [Bacteroidia bacterium]|nr:response regulator transcription factor [Bacteroidia bacterium]
MNQVKILLVEDDNNLGQLLKEYLDIKGFRTSLGRDGEEAWKMYQTQSFDFCILDVMLPKLDGFSLAERIRETDRNIPIIFLTAKSLKDDTIHGLKIGADDYITKPFRMEELLLRIEAILRRSLPPSSGESANEEYQIGKLTFAYHSQKLLSENKEQKLTSREAELLKLLCQHKNQVLDRSYALKKIWQDDSYFNARSMDVYITKLRKYLRADENVQIINVHGQGFKLVVLK